MLSQREFILNYDHSKVSDKSKGDMDLDAIETEIDEIASEIIIKV